MVVNANPTWWTLMYH